MGITYTLLVLSFLAIIFLNLGWAITNLYFFIVDGVQTLIVGSTFVENIYFSTYLKWILLIDAMWISSAIIFASTRQSYKTDSKLHYLNVNPINEPKIFVIIPTYNEEKVVEKVINDYKNQKFVKTILVVEDVSDLWTFERIGFYRGMYHVLGGSLSAINGIGIDEIAINKLIKRIEKNNVQEVILALSTTMEGQTTSYVISDKLEKITNLEVTRLAQGVPFGGEVHYLDENTLDAAFQSRKKIN